MKQYQDIVRLMRTLTLPGMSISQCFKHLSEIPRLTQEEETDLSTLVQHGAIASDRLNEVIRVTGMPDHLRHSAGVTGMVCEILAGDEAKWRLVFHSLRLAFWAAGVSVGWRTSAHPGASALSHKRSGGRRIEDLSVYAGDRLPFMDRFQEAVFGLTSAATAYRPGGAAFGTYAATAVIRSIERAVLDERYRNTLGPGEAESFVRTMRVLDRVQKATGKEPSLEELAELSRQGVKAAQRRLEERLMIPLQSLEEVLAEQPLIDVPTRERLRPGDVLGDPDLPDGYESAEFSIRSKALADVMRTLSEREAGVIALCFGIRDGVPRTRDEIGQIYGVSPDRIREIESKAMMKLRHPSRSNLLRSYIQSYGRAEQATPTRHEVTVKSHPTRYDFTRYPWLADLVSA